MRSTPKKSLLLVLAAVCSAASAAAADIDPDTGLIVAPGWELVRAHCGVCHDYKLVTAQRGDAVFWRDTIRWMQRTQNLWALEAGQEESIIQYLSSHYDETDWERRPRLPAELMPPSAQPL